MHQSQAERLCSIIEQQILSLELKPGEKLDESRLAEKYGTSRTPVREALRQLSATGLIEIRPHKGAIVARIGIREIAELFEVMAELEGACGRLAAKACLSSDVDAIAAQQKVCRHQAQMNDIQSYQWANEAFHETIYRASRNGCLINLALSIRNRIAPYRRLLLDRLTRVQPSVEEHENILRAIQEGLPDEADRLLQLHISKHGDELRRLVPSLSMAGPERASGNGAIRFGSLSSLQSASVK
jgi:DNA-binding GntR family transcriptional regulator